MLILRLRTELNFWLSMKKLLYIVTEPTHMQSLILPLMERMNEEFDIVCICSADNVHIDARKVGVRTLKLPIHSLSLWQSLKNLWFLWRTLRHEKPDIVHTLTPKAGLLGMSAAFLARIPARMHTFSDLIFPRMRGLSRLIPWMTDVVTCLLANVINPGGEEIQQLLRASHVTRKSLLLITQGNINGVNLKHFIPGKNRDEKREMLGIGKDAVAFVFIGNIVTEKGVAELVDAFCWLHQEHPNTRLILIGRDDIAPDLLPKGTRRKATSHPGIICAGEQYDAETWLAAGDVYVHPSHHEGHSHYLLWAGAMGLPVITYDVRGCRGIVNAETGIVIPLRDYSALYEGMLQLINHPTKRLSLGLAARHHIEKHFDSQHVCQELKKIYQELVP